MKLTKEEKTAAKKTAETRSKVCVIANALSKQGMSRSTAFKEAWKTVKSTIETKVAGVTFENRQQALENLKKYNTEHINIILAREKENEHDNNAIAVIVSVKDKGAYKMGYIPRTLSKMVAPLMDYGKNVKAVFKEIRGKYHSYHNYGMKMSLII